MYNVENKINVSMKPKPQSPNRPSPNHRVLRNNRKKMSQMYIRNNGAQSRRPTETPRTITALSCGGISGGPSNGL